MASPRYFTVEEATAALPEVERLLERLRELTDALDAKDVLEAVMEDLDSIGCVVRDLDLGLVDFPALAGGTEVFLCWRLGEDAIGYWHGTAEGYAGRKPLRLLPGGHFH